MDTTVIKVPSSLSRHFLETRLGFGRPFNSDALSSLFKSKEGCFRYAAHDSNFQASINAVSEVDWEAIHFNEKGVVIHDISIGPIERINSFVRHELKKRGFVLIDATTHQETAVLIDSINVHLNSFVTQYREEVDPSIELHSSLAMRESDPNMNWDVTFRVFLKSELETIFISIHVPRIVRNVALFIEEAQVNKTVESVYKYLEGFAPYSTLFLPLQQFDIVKLLVHRVFLSRLVKSDDADKLYAEYRKSIMANKALFEGDLRGNRNAQFDYVENTVNLWEDNIHRTMLLSAMEMALQQLETYLKFNKAVAAMTEF